MLLATLSWIYHVILTNAYGIICCRITRLSCDNVHQSSIRMWNILKRVNVQG